MSLAIFFVIMAFGIGCFYMMKSKARRVIEYSQAPEFELQSVKHTSKTNIKNTTVDFNGNGYTPVSIDSMPL
jgi:hypothetical protein